MTEVDLVALFDPSPSRWGLRGDPHVWNRMRELAAGARPAADADDAIRWLHTTFEEIVGVEIATSTDEHVRRPELDHGGMSGGMVHLETWRTTLMPLLEQRVREAE